MQYSELIKLGHCLSPFVVGTEGNVSQRTAEGFVVTASGSSFTYLSDDDIVRCNIDGDPATGEHNKPSMEASFHAWIYQNSDYKFVAHTHPTNTLKILCTDWCHSFAREKLFPDQVVFNSDACVVPYACPGESLAYIIDETIKEYGSFPRLLLLRNHGIICCANSAKEALIMTEICEKAAEVFIGAKSIGCPLPLSYVQTQTIMGHPDEVYRRQV